MFLGWVIHMVGPFCKLGRKLYPRKTLEYHQNWQNGFFCSQRSWHTKSCKNFNICFNGKFLNLIPDSYQFKLNYKGQTPIWATCVSIPEQGETEYVAIVKVDFPFLRLLFSERWKFGGSFASRSRLSLETFPFLHLSSGFFQIARR